MRVNVPEMRLEASFVSMANSVSERHVISKMKR